MRCCLYEAVLSKIPLLAAEGTDVTEGRVLRLRLWDLLRWMLAVNSTVLSDCPGLKHFNFEFGILHSPRQLVVKNATGRRSAVLL